jgi:hypothetical protein
VKPARISLIWQILILLAGLFVLSHDLVYGWEAASNFSGYGDPGFETDGFSCGRDGYCPVTAVTPGGPGQRAGLRKGDQVRFDRSIDVPRYERVGETVGFTVRRNGASWHRSIVMGPLRVDARARANAVAIVSRVAVVIPILLLGVFVVLRSRRRASTCLFGATLICFSWSGVDGLTLAEGDPRLYPLFLTINFFISGAGVPLFFAFALAVRRDLRGKTSLIWWIALTVFAVMGLAFICFWIFENLTLDYSSKIMRFVSGVAYPLVVSILALLVLALTWRENRGQERTRVAFMLIAGVILFVCRGVLPGVATQIGSNWTLGDPIIVLGLVGSVAGSAVLAYALLRHRIVDLGFAINRTLVYGVVSAILLAVFGLIDWAVERFLPIHGRAGNALIDAGAAVVVFLIFHRVRDVVEHVIERLFFRRWQMAEAELRRFVREAAFVTRAPALEERFVEALTRFGEGAASAVYSAEDGGYPRKVGEVPGVPPRLDPDLPSLVGLRAEPQPVEVQEGPLSGRLIAPMVNRNEVLGFAVLGPKPSGLAWRPDEVELIGWATRQVGLDLHALKVEQLQSAQAELSSTVAMLRSEIATLRSVIPR